MIVTIVSVLPFKFVIPQNPTVVPSAIEIPPVNKGDIGIAYQEDAVTYIYLDEDRGFASRKILGEEQAEAAIQDHWSSMLHTDHEQRPGVFWVPGQLTKDEVKKKFSDKIEDAEARQKAWFEKLVRVATDNWEQYRSHRVIDDTQRFAARYLGVGDKHEWVSAAPKEELVKCPVCVTLINRNAVVCSSCNAVLNEEKYKHYKFAGQGQLVHATTSK